MHLNGRLNAQVESDIVGYQTMALTQKFNLVGVNFADLSGSDTVLAKDFITGEFTNGDQLQIPSASGYDVLEWYDGKWCAYGGTIESDKSVVRGTGVWIVTKGATVENPVSVTVSGAVNLSDALTITFGQKYVLASPGLPKDYSVNTKELTWENLAEGDQLQIPSASGYDVLEWYDSKWCAYGGTVESNKVIPAGVAVWIVSTANDAKVTMTPPTTLAD